jgi:hypothetical protein
VEVLRDLPERALSDVHFDTDKIALLIGNAAAPCSISDRRRAAGSAAGT